MPKMWTNLLARGSLDKNSKDVKNSKRKKEETTKPRVTFFRSRIVKKEIQEKREEQMTTN